MRVDAVVSGCGCALIALWLFVGCNKTQKETTPEGMPVLVQDQVLDAGPSPRLDAAHSESQQAASRYPLTGIPSCDEYIAKMDRCLAKMPAASEQAVREAFGGSIEAWRELEGPAREALGQACTHALEAAANAYRAMGCEF